MMKAKTSTGCQMTANAIKEQLEAVIIYTEDFLKMAKASRFRAESKKPFTREQQRRAIGHCNRLISELNRFKKLMR